MGAPSWANGATPIADYIPLWPVVEPLVRARQPNGKIPKAQGPWVGPLHSPLREDANPSFSIRPDSPDNPGAFKDHATGDSGSMAELATRLGIDPHVSSNVRPPTPFERFCKDRLLDEKLLRTHFAARPATWNGRPALRYATGGGPDRVKFLDGQKPKYTWVTKGGRLHLYNLARAQSLLSSDHPTLYIVNGEPSVWAADQAGVPAVCLAGGEGAAPTAALISELKAIGAIPVRVVYDVGEKHDKPGTGARAVAAALREARMDASALQLPSDLGKGGDVDDLRQRVGDQGLADALKGLPEVERADKPATFPRHTASAFIDLPAMDYLVDGLLPASGLGAIVGPPGSFKTFVAVDVALSAASGRLFYGRKVKQVPVLYILEEGRAGFGQRLLAQKLGHQVALPDTLQIVSSPVQLANPTQLDLLLATIADMPTAPGLVIVDTLARAFVGFDENAAKDMGILMASLQRVAEATGGLVLALHHPTKLGGVRGSSALEGALDVIIGIEKTGTLTATVRCLKMKDAAEFEPFHLKGRVVTLNTPGASSLVFDLAGTAEATPSPMNETVRAVLRILESLTITGTISAGEWERASAAEDIPRRSFYRARTILLDLGFAIAEAAGKYQRYRAAQSGASAKVVPIGANGTAQSGANQCHPPLGVALVALDGDSTGYGPNGDKEF